MGPAHCGPGWFQAAGRVRTDDCPESWLAGGQGRAGRQATRESELTPPGHLAAANDDFPEKQIGVKDRTERYRTFPGLWIWFSLTVEPVKPATTRDASKTFSHRPGFFYVRVYFLGGSCVSNNDPERAARTNAGFGSVFTLNNPAFT